MASVSLENICKSFRSRREVVNAVDELSLDVRDGEFVVILGPSGSGKSTTLRLVAGLETPDRGIVRIGGDDVTNVEPRDRNVAMVFQNYALYPHMTVFRNLAFGLKMRRVPKGEIRVKVGAVARKLAIEHLLDRKPGQLSGGERQRVALGRAIVRDPNVFLLDEPIASVDPSLRTQLRGEIKELHRELQSTFLYVTHDQEEAMTLGDRIAVMNHGSLLQYDTPLQVYDRPVNRFVAGFVGSPAMNFLPGRLETADGDTVISTSVGRIPLSAEIASRLRAGSEAEFVVGVRPEDLEVVSDRTANVAGAGPSSAGCCLDALPVTLVETLGHSVRVHVGAHPNNKLIAVLPRSCHASVGDHLRLCVDIEKVHLFSATDDGARLA